MALIKLGAFVTEISGKIGGTIFSRSKGGAYAKNRVIPTNPQTQAQQLVRQVFGAIAQAWRGLTGAQRLSWDAAVDDYPYQNRLGEQKTLSGVGLHQQLNLNLNSVGATLLNSPLSPALVNSASAIVLVMAAVGVSGQTIDVTLADPSVDTDFSIEATESVSVGVTNTSNRFKRIGVLTAADAGSPFSIKTAYEAVFGSPLVGARINVRLKPVNKLTGQAGTASTQTTIVVA